MSDSDPTSANTRSCEEKYVRFRTAAGRAVVRATFGHEIVCGYTTSLQAERLSRALRLGHGDRLLDLGAGRGWPGAYIAGRSGCALVSTDLPLEALRPARRHLESLGLARPPHVVGADARALPFRPAIFNAVVHADVLC